MLRVCWGDYFPPLSRAHILRKRQRKLPDYKLSGRLSRWGSRTKSPSFLILHSLPTVRLALMQRNESPHTRAVPPGTPLRPGVGRAVRQPVADCRRACENKRNGCQSDGFTSAARRLIVRSCREPSTCPASDMPLCKAPSTRGPPHQSPHAPR